MAVLGAFAAPGAAGRAIYILHEVGHILGGFPHVHVWNTEKAGGLAKIEKLENAPSIRGMRIPPTSVRWAELARTNHLLPPILGGIRHAAALAQHGDSLRHQRLSNIAPHRQT